MTLVLHLPFDESNGSEIAYDYSPSLLHANVVNGRFIKGREGNCVYFPGTGRAEIVGTQPINLAGSFTMHMWCMAEIKGSFPTETYFLIKFAGKNQFLRIELKANLHNWTHVALTKQGNTFTSYANGKPSDIKESPSEWGDPTGFCLLNDTPDTGGGFCYIDNFIALNDQVLASTDFINIISKATLPLNFYINGRNFKDFGVEVKDMRGIFSRLETKSKASYDWTEYHGTVEDLSDIRFVSRKFEFDCWFSQVGKDATIENVMALKMELSKSGLVRIMIELGSKPFIYECAVKEQIDFEVLKWRDGKMFTELTLKFVEPQPVKRILLFTATDSSKQASITLKSEESIDIYWGDGAVTSDAISLYNDAGVELPNTITHTFAENGQYYILLYGVIEKIDAATFATNAVPVWPMLS